ncbi:MAG: indole-3-glycerol phosphate synthase TrpC [Planctomycetaceae bacterium]|nr:indole-3-glycerol phosphate synthase TrpC [Planctomycetaceae bacterium]
MVDVLADIVATKRGEVAERRQQVPLAELHATIPDLPKTRDFVGALRGAPPLRLIAEVKKASPSAGLIRSDFDPVEIARAYEAGGASCLSVLTDRPYFQGDLAYLQRIRDQVSLPLLRKDFIIDPYQIYEARVAGADAVLLIAECLSVTQLRDFYQLARSLGLAVLSELHDPENLDAVLDSGTEIVGVNNRDLRTFRVDTQQTIRIRAQVPQDRLLVGESGVKNRALVLEWQAAGVDAMLVGETLMRQPDLTVAVRSLLGLDEPMSNRSLKE